MRKPVLRLFHGFTEKQLPRCSVPKWDRGFHHLPNTVWGDNFGVILEDHAMLGGKGFNGCNSRRLIIKLREEIRSAFALHALHNASNGFLRLRVEGHIGRRLRERVAQKVTTEERRDHQNREDITWYSHDYSVALSSSVRLTGQASTHSRQSVQSRWRNFTAACGARFCGHFR